MSLEIMKVLVLSTAHITEQDNELLLLHAGEPFSKVKTIRVAADEYGFFIYAGNYEVPDNNEAHYSRLREFNVSESLIKVLKLAVKNKCQYVRLDRDVAVVKDEGLDTHDW
jgi:hypothetical protein